ncbi:PREDICTED: uncharacterized protein LOC109585103 [Amphimedon queenslandica]|uniref:Caspase family p20 domain-containing protein n=1 Tax=Amphimedon queenslandica TaxID=400682 RepID=A0AAN0JIK9_AMPQE|nr:PREDICTED: uncharacterized protein LOC109585103 [Amphimedon queenslandica]|eukprot:XP_019856607.1 PREDICTED: uncharacterized protein LOC109585103 [Amphimedon queenslandica]
MTKVTLLFMFLQIYTKVDLKVAHITAAQVKSIPFLSCYISNELESFDTINDVTNTIFRHCSLLNHDILLQLIGNFQFTSSLRALQSLEDEQQYYCRKLISSEFMEELNILRTTICSSLVPVVEFEFPIDVLSSTTVSEFKLTLCCIFSELASFLHLYRIICSKSLVRITLCGPEGLRTRIASKVKCKSRYILNVAGASSCTCDILGRVNEENSGIKDDEQEVDNKERNDLTKNEQLLNEDSKNQVINEVAIRTSPKESPVAIVQSTEVGPMCIYPACIESQLHEGPIPDVSVTKSSKLVVKPVLLVQPLKKDTEVKEVKELEFDESEPEVACKPRTRKRVNTWRLFQPQDRDVLIIGSFGAFSKQYTVAPKIVPSHLKGEKWMSDEIERIKNVYEKYNERFEVFFLSHGFPGEEKSRQDYIDMIKALFYSKKHKGAVIWYTGHGERGTGNWCFKDGIISFDDIFNLYCSHYMGSSLTIVSDCSYSGQWINDWARKLDEFNIPACGHHARRNKFLIKIIASCQHDEEATALSFISEGVDFDEDEKGLMHCHDGKVLESGQRCFGIDFRVICCGKGRDETCEIDSSCSSKFTWTQCISGSSELIYIVTGKSKEHENVWHCLLLDKKKLDVFKGAVSTAETIDVSSYGEILHSGIGNKPPAWLHRDLELRFVKCPSDMMDLRES